MSTGLTWFGWALLSALFAALTAIFAKAGLQRIDPDLATWIRTGVVWGALTLLLTLAGKWSDPSALSARTWAFLVLSGLAAGASWLCYFRALSLGDAAQVAPVDKASLLLLVLFAYVFLGERPFSREWLGIALIGAGVVLLGLRAAERPLLPIHPWSAPAAACARTGGIIDAQAGLTQVEAQRIERLG